MLPVFGHVLYAEYPDQTRTLLAWGTDRSVLGDALPAFARAVDPHNPPACHIVPSWRVKMVELPMGGYDLEVSDPEPL